MSQKRDAFYLCELKDWGIFLLFLSLATLDSLLHHVLRAPEWAAEAS